MNQTALEKSLQTIDLLSRHPQGLSLAEMSDRLGFPKSTIHRILKTFMAYDYVSQDREDRKYSLGFRFLTIGSIILGNLDVRRTAGKYLRQLHRQCNETVHLSVLRRGRVCYIDKIQKPAGLSLATYTGFTTEPHATGSGKVLFSELPPREIKAIYTQKPLKKYSPGTITDMAQLLKELQKVRRQGYAVDNEEHSEGVRCVAAPIRAYGKIVAALSISGSVFSIKMERIERELIGLVIKTAQAISAEMS